MKKIGGISLALFLVSAIASAADHPQDCKEIRLDAPGGPMERIPVYDQATTGTCYAHAAAEALDAERVLQSNQALAKKTDATSPLDAIIVELNDRQTNPNNPYYVGKGGVVTLSYQDKACTERANDKDKTCLHWVEASGGMVCPVIDALKKTGTCSVGRMDPFAPNRTMDPAILNRLREYFRKAREEVPHTPQFEQNVDVLAFEVAELACGNRKLTDDMYTEVQGQLRSTFGRPLPDNGGQDNWLEDEMQFLRTALDLFCQPRQPVPAAIQCAGATNEQLQSNATKKATYDGLLERNHPVIIEMCADLLDDDDPIHFDGLKDKNGKPTTCASHAVLVAGRRWNKKAKRCEYMIRNSWGTDCDGYADEWDCDKKRGDVWVDQTALLRNVDGVQYLNP